MAFIFLKNSALRRPVLRLGRHSLARVVAAAALTLMAQPSSAYVETPPFRWTPGFVRFTSLGSYYNSSANLTDGRGEFQNLPNSGSFNQASGRLRGRYHLSESVSMYVGGSYAFTETKNSIYGTRQNSTFTDASAGLNVLLLDSSWRLVGELEGSFATDQATYERQDAMGSDGVHYGKASVYLFKSLGGWANLLASTGVKYRAEGLATQALWSVAFEKPFLKRFLIGFGLDGYESIISDTLYPRDRNQLTDRANAGSRRHYGFNDALTEAGVWIGFAPVPALQMRLGYERGLTGQRAAIGNAFFLALSFSFEPRPEPESFSTEAYARQRTREEMRSRSDAKSFRVKEEQTDDSLFYEDVPANGKRRRLRPTPSAPAPAYPRGGGSNPLDETERSLESPRN